MSIRQKPYEVWYEVETDNGYEYVANVRCQDFNNHLEAIYFADDMWKQYEVSNVVVKHYGWDFYAPGAEDYFIIMLDFYEQDETIVFGPKSFVDCLQELLKLQWTNKLDWVAYKLEHYVCPAEPVCPSAPDNYLENDELPF